MMYLVLSVVFMLISGYIWLFRGDNGNAGFYLALAALNYCWYLEQEIRELKNNVKIR